MSSAEAAGLRSLRHASLGGGEERPHGGSSRHREGAQSSLPSLRYPRLRASHEEPRRPGFTTARVYDGPGLRRPGFTTARVHERPGSPPSRRRPNPRPEGMVRSRELDARGRLDRVCREVRPGSASAWARGAVAEVRRAPDPSSAGAKGQCPAGQTPANQSARSLSQSP
jgi:hypothetical protein